MFDVKDVISDYCIEDDPDSSPAFDDSVVLFCHGNGDDLGTAKPYAQWLSAKLRRRVVAFDYPGYGHSTGTTSESTIYEGALLAYNYCVDLMRIQP